MNRNANTSRSVEENCSVFFKRPDWVVFFTFFCENLRAVWVVRLTVIVCFFFRAPSVPFIATRGSSSVEETQAAVFIMLTRLQWKGWQRSQKETDTSAVTWNTHTHTLSQAVLKGDYGVLLCSSWPQLAGWAMAVNSILRGNFNRLSTSKWSIIFFKCLTTLQRGSLQRQNLFVFTKKKKKNPNCFFLPARST